MKQIKVGLLPLYIKLYDDCGTDRTYTTAFYDRMAGLLKNQGFDVIKTDYCRVEEEFIDVVCAPDITAAERLAHIHAIEYGIANDWEGVCVWRVIGEPLKGEDDIDSFLDKWANY